MKIENIIQTIEILKSDFKARYGVEPNVCRIGIHLIERIIHDCNIESLKSNVEIKILCGMEVEPVLYCDYKIQVGYFSEACHLDCEVE